MKFTIKLLACFGLLLTLSLVSSAHLKSERVKRSKFDYTAEVPKTWTRAIGEAYRDMAGLGYATLVSATEQLAEIKKPTGKDTAKVGYLFKTLFETQKWEHIVTWTGDATTNNYSFTIIRNAVMKKVVLAFSGTKGFTQLRTEVLQSSGEVYFRNSSSPVKIMKYFHQLFQKIITPFYEGFARAINKDIIITQYIFVGHSLGGAMASIALFDSVKQGVVKTTAISPVLITYGQPRTGNYAFANEIAKIAPIVYRHVNNFDLVAGTPDCGRDRGNCFNEFGKVAIDPTYNTYTATYSDEKDKFYPWHLQGLIFNIGDQETNSQCVTKSENVEEDCKHTTSLSFAFHRYYYGYKVSNLYKPEALAYTGVETCESDRNPPVFVLTTLGKDVWKEAEDESIITTGVCKALMWTFRATGALTKKKK